MRRDDHHIEPLFAALGHRAGEEEAERESGPDPKRSRRRTWAILLVAVLLVALFLLIVRQVL